MCVEIKVKGPEGSLKRNGDVAGKMFEVLGYERNYNYVNQGQEFVEIRIVGKDGLTTSERKAINSILETLGYTDLSHFAIRNKITSFANLADQYSYTNVRDFFLSDGWYERLEPFRINKRSV